jgi:hypothetical protein
MTTCRICKVTKEDAEYYASLGAHITFKRCCIERAQKSRRKRRTEHPEREWSKNSLQSHKARGFKNEITLTELCLLAENSKECRFCGRKLNWQGNSKVPVSDTPSLDRLNNENTLRANNVMIVCHECNAIKQNLTLPQFIEFCKKVVEHHPTWAAHPVLLGTISQIVPP